MTSIPVAVPDYVELRRAADGTGQGVLATRSFDADETVMVGS